MGRWAAGTGGATGANGPVGPRARTERSAAGPQARPELLERWTEGPAGGWDHRLTGATGARVRLARPGRLERRCARRKCRSGPQGIQVFTAPRAKTAAWRSQVVAEMATATRWNRLSSAGPTGNRRVGQDVWRGCDRHPGRQQRQALKRLRRCGLHLARSAARDEPHRSPDVADGEQRRRTGILRGHPRGEEGPWFSEIGRPMETCRRPRAPAGIRPCWPAAAHVRPETLPGGRAHTGSGPCAQRNWCGASQGPARFVLIVHVS